MPEILRFRGTPEEPFATSFGRSHSQPGTLKAPTNTFSRCASPLPHCEHADAAAALPSPPDDKAGTTSADSPHRTVPHPPPPDGYDLHPTTIACSPASSSHTATAPPPAPRRERASTRCRSPLYPPRTSHIRPDRAQTPAPADTPDRSAAATDARRSPNKTSAAFSPQSPADTIGRAVARSVPPADSPSGAPVQPLREPAPAKVASWTYTSFSLRGPLSS